MPEITTFHGGDENLPEERIFSIDVFRGLVLFLLLLGAANGDWAIQLANANPESWWAKFVALQFSHMAWVGCSLWDLVQPAFMFLVGVALPFSFLKRARGGERYGDLLVHAIIRSLILILLGVFLRSMNAESTNWTFTDVLSQIGLGYFFVFLMWRKWWRIQAVTGLAVLFLYWLLFVIWKAPVEGFDWTIAEGQGWQEPLSGFASHWNKNANPAHAFDLWFLNGFSRLEPFVAHPGGYQTLNFIPAFVTMLIGLMVGEYIQDENKTWAVPKVLVFLGFASVLIGTLLDASGICPIVKRVWTPAFVLYSGGWCVAIMGIFYGAFELNQSLSRIGKPLTFLGMNSLIIYLACWIAAPWLNQMLKIHFGEDYAGFFGAGFQPLIENVITMLIIWLLAWWMYRRRIFVRV